MARIIEKIVEAVIEDPVVDIFAEPIDEGNDVAGLVPALNSGPVIGRGRFHPSGDGVLPEERFSDASGQSMRAADPGRDSLLEPGNFSFPPRSGTVGADVSDPGPLGLTSSRASPPPSTLISPSNDSTENDDDGAQEPPPDSGDDTSPDEVSDESGGSELPAETGGDESDPSEASQADTTIGATIFGTEGDDLIEMQFVFPAEIRTEPGTLNRTTPNADVVIGNGGDDTISGGGGGDVIDGGSGDDILNGEAGHDALVGGSGDDTLDGGGDDDILIGGSGNDELTGGGGTDQLVGGSGADRFVFDDVAGSPAQAPDLVFDFNAVQGDQIDVSGIDAISGTMENDEFIFVGDDAFSGSAGELHLTHDLSDGLLEGDVNGDATADFTINLLGVTSLTGDDIMGLA